MSQFYRHYKNKPYKFLGIVKHSETLEDFVLYQPLYKNELSELWVRPKDMFFEDINVNETLQPRFKPIRFKVITYSTINDKLINDINEIQLACFNTILEKDTLNEKIRLHPNIFFIVAYEDEKPVGMKLGYQLEHNRFYSWKGGVLPEYRKLGLATLMMKTQHEWCKKNNFSLIETRSRSQYKNMVSLNLSFGFEIVGTLKDKKGLKIIFEKRLE